MPRGLGTTPQREWSTTAGRSLPEPEPAAEPTSAAPATPEPRPAPEPKPVKPIRQTLDLPPTEYHAVQDAARDLAREIGANSREVNAQTLLRALVARMISDDELLTAVRQDVRTSVGK